MTEYDGTLHACLFRIFEHTAHSRMIERIDDLLFIAVDGRPSRNSLLRLVQPRFNSANQLRIVVLPWCFIAKTNSKPNEALLSCQITIKIIENYTPKIFTT
ncbi:hypothetical protein EVAR_8622_1 [Eumeta japonica]|uniref:Uncharacterized protein n=1 Tax=Eumeta variegata TaxID=151549 RepID=A0A4C1XGH3_EUMVA|nr:hypothetical protein EVAR_8622_1 [Eumeta japonica]